MKGAKTPTGTTRAEAPGLNVVREKAEAVPVESVAPEMEIDEFLDPFKISVRICLNSKGAYAAPFFSLIIRFRLQLP